jgi:hypothetical protein
VREAVLTLQEVSQHLRLPIEVVREEISAGHLRVMNFAGHIRVSESDLSRFEEQAKSPSLLVAQLGAVSDDSLQLRPASPFIQKWPDGSEERYDNSQEGTVRYLGTEFGVKLGFCRRNAAGCLRVRALVLIDRYPTVEFAGVDGTIGGAGLIASVIKDRRRRHIPVGSEIPPEYQAFQVSSYRDVVNGPGAPSGLAVICAQTDYVTMVRHALIRYTQSDWKRKRD